MSYLVLARKWRPKTFSQVAGQQVTLQALSNALQSQRIHHAYLFTGTRGVGKTTLARLLAKCLNCEVGISAKPCEQCAQCQAINSGAAVDVLEVDAASRTKVEDTRELLDNIQYAPTQARFKIYIIDEVHMLSGHSFNALLKTLEEPPAHVKFILATTDPQKLPQTVLSRCLRFHLNRLSVETIETHLAHILSEEHVTFEKPALTMIAHAAMGSMRDALSLLEQVLAWGADQVTECAAQNILGTVGTHQQLALLDHLINQNTQAALTWVDSLWQQGAEFEQVLTEFQTLLHQLALVQWAPETLSPSLIEREAMIEASKKILPETIQYYYQMTLHGQRDLPYAPDWKKGFEMLVLRMLHFVPLMPTKPQSPPPKQETPKAQQPTRSAPAMAQTPAQTSTQMKVQPQTKTPTMEPTPTPTLDPTPTPPLSETPSTVRRATHMTPEAWQQQVQALGLSGLAKVILEHCAVKTWALPNIELVLDATQAPLLQERHQQRIEEALSRRLGQSCKVAIELAKENHETPMALKKEARAQAQQQAEQQVHTDPVVQKVIETFDAQLESVTLNEQS